MRIAFYSPMKSPNHPVPSGDRQMARLLVKALQHAGHTVEIASELRSYRAEPDQDHYAGVQVEAHAEAERLSRRLRAAAAPDLWLSYHPYYKAPDYLGPSVAHALGIPYVTAEASLSGRRNIGAWAHTQSVVAEAVCEAATNLCFTARDENGLQEYAPSSRTDRIAPFIDTTEIEPRNPDSTSRLITVAMMRPGDKLDSYRFLAAALELLLDTRWTLSVVGDGPDRDMVKSAFAGLATDRIEWLGQLAGEDVRSALARSSIYVWPGCGEAYGLAYLEAQAAGLPVVAFETAGVPEVVVDRTTGFLTPAGDIGGYARAVRQLLENAERARTMGAAARAFVLGERSLEVAARRIDAVIRRVVG